MFKIFPLTLTNDGRKVPIKELKNWKEKATSDPAIIAEWQRLYGHKIKLWGIKTGPDNGILTLDVDVKGGGLETIKKYHVPITLSQTTMSGGKHHIYKYPNDGKVYGNRVAFDHGLDIRGENGYIACYDLDSVPITDAPDWLLNQAVTVKKEEIKVEDAVQIAPHIAQEIVKTACDNVRNAPEGESNNQLNIEAYNVGQLLPSNSIDRDYAYNELFRAAKDRGKQDFEAKATILSGFDGGAKAPMTCPFGNVVPSLFIPIDDTPPSDRWTPKFFSRYDLFNTKNLRKPQLFKNWSTEDIHLTTADGGTGKTTLKLYEAVCLALGESFLGFECITPGRTLYITGEDTAAKLGAMIGMIAKDMGLANGSPENEAKLRKITDSIVVKKAEDLCLVTKTKDNFLNLNSEGLEKVLQAVEDIKPKLIVFDPIASFWGSEAALNDMAKAVSKFMGILVEKSNACVEMLNHMGKSSSSNKDMSQFAGRGGTGLPSHSRVSRVLRPIWDEEFEERTGRNLESNQTAMVCNVNKFSDGSPLYNNEFIIVREGYLFSRVTLIEQKVKEEQIKVDDNERIFRYIKDERMSKRYPTKNVIVAEFLAKHDKISKERVNRAIECLAYTGHMGEKIKVIENPIADNPGKLAFIVTDMEGREL